MYKKSELESLLKYSGLGLFYINKLNFCFFNSEARELVCLNDDNLQNIYSGGHKKSPESFLFLYRKSMIKVPLVLLVHPASRLISSSI